MEPFFLKSKNLRSINEEVFKVSGRTDRCFDFLGAEFASACDCYDANGKTIGKGDAFILISVDAVGMALIRRSSEWPKGRSVFIDYEFLEGSRPTGRVLRYEDNTIMDGSSLSDALPPLDEFWK